MEDVSVRARACVLNTSGNGEKTCGFYAPMTDVFCVPETRILFLPTFDCCGLWREVSFMNRQFVCFSLMIKHLPLSVRCS